MLTVHREQASSRRGQRYNGALGGSGLQHRPRRRQDNDPFTEKYNPIGRRQIARAAAQASHAHGGDRCRTARSLHHHNHIPAAGNNNTSHHHYDDEDDEQRRLRARGAGGETSMSSGYYNNNYNDNNNDLPEIGEIFNSPFIKKMGDSFLALLLELTQDSNQPHEHNFLGSLLLPPLLFCHRYVLCKDDLPYSVMFEKAFVYNTGIP